MVVDACILRRVPHEEIKFWLEESLSLSSLSASHLQTRLSDVCAIKAMNANVSTEDTTIFYECEATNDFISEHIFHAVNVIPFGLRSPSEVFAMRGRHTNKGVIVNCLPNGLFEVMPYKTADKQPLQVNHTLSYMEQPYNKNNNNNNNKENKHKYYNAHVNDKCHNKSNFIEAIRAKCCSVEVTSEISSFFTTSHNQNDCDNSNSNNSIKFNEQKKCKEATRTTKHMRDRTQSNSDLEHDKVTELWELRDLQLPPALSFSLHGPSTSTVHAVHSRVLARRFGCIATLHLATVICVYYDISYALQYDSDSVIDVGVLHSDIVLLSSDNAEPYRVRDRVLIRMEKQVPALILDALGDAQYRVMLQQQQHQQQRLSCKVRYSNNVNKEQGELRTDEANELAQVLILGAKDILHLIPSFPQALHSPEYILKWFKQLDKSGRGEVRWKDVRQFMQNWEMFSVPLSFQRIGDLLREVALRKRNTEPQLLHKMPMHDDEMLLDYNEFEYIILRAQNLM